MPAVSLLTTNREALTALFDLVASRSWEVAYPAARAGGWWELSAWLPDGQLTAVLGTLGPDAAVVWQSDRGLRLQVRAGQDVQRLSLVPESAAGRDAAGWLDWLRSVGLRAPGRAAAARAWAAAGQERPQDVFGIIGPASFGRRPFRQQSMPWELLSGATGGGTAPDHYPFLGLCRIAWQHVRWPLAYGGDCWAVWDRAYPQQSPGRHWPPGMEGLLAARDHQRELIDEPLLARTVLSGQRCWARLGGGFEDSSVVLHFGLDQRLALVVARPGSVRTWELSLPGLAILNTERARAAGRPMTPTIHQTLVLKDLDDAVEAANIALSAHLQTAWQPVPDDVGVGFNDTVSRSVEALLSEPR